MQKFKLIFLFILISFVSWGQSTSKQNQNKIWVKHLNLITHEEEVWEFDNTDFKSSEIKHTTGFNGEIENLTDNNSLKSLYPISTIIQNPQFPESSILFLVNALSGIDLTATLISPKYVLTSASHIYPARNNLDKLYIASFNYFRGLDSDHKSFATDIYFFTTTFITNADWHNNIALIKLNRPMGATLGWMGFGFEDNEFYGKNEFLYTFIDAHTVELKKFSAHPDIFKDDSFYFTNPQPSDGAPFYMKGGEIHGISCFAKYVDGFVTHNGVGRITEQKLNTINTIITDDLPTEPDVMPLILNAEPRTIEAGKSLSNLSFFIHNYSGATFSGEIRIDIHISKDNIIDQKDPIIESYFVNVEMDPRKTYRVTPPTKPRISLFTKPGAYLIGARINTSDFDLNNNITQGLDCDTITVTNQYATNQISGKVSTSFNTKSPGQCVLLKYKDDHLHMIYDKIEVNENGEYKFENVLLGVYNILFVPSPDNFTDMPTYYSTTPYWDKASSVLVVLNDTLKNTNFNSINANNLSGQKIVSGTLSMESEKSVTNSSPNLTNDVCIYLHAPDQETPLCFCRPNTSGYYQFKKLTAGTYQIKVDKPGYNLSSFHTLDLTSDTDSITSINFIFSADSTITAQNLTAFPILDTESIFNVYPNPATDKIYVETNIPNCTIKLLNLLGQKIVEYSLSNATKKEIDLTFLTSGSYVVTLKSNKNLNFSKILIKK